MSDDLVRAFELAVESADRAAIEAIASRIAAAPDPERARLGDRARAVALRRHAPFAEGLVAEACGALDDAIDLYTRAEAFADAARIHRARGELARAGRALERHVSRNPGDVAARKSLASLLLEVGRPEPALRVLRDLPDDDVVRATRDAAHRALGLIEASGAPAPRPDREEALLFGRYQLVREVASTATARVLEAIDTLDPERARVALKVFTGTGHAGAGRDALARFRREIEALRRLDVPAVLRPRALLDEGPTLVLPWAGGGSVADRIAAERLTARRAAEIVSRVLEALDAAHRRGILHRDVKPANVLLDEAGGAYLADFGVAHLGDTTTTATAGAIGTLRYMAPEQRLGEPATTRSDLYATGVLLAELLGLAPEPASIARAPEPIATLLGALLQDDPAARPPDAATVRARLDAIAWPDEPLRLDPATTVDAEGPRTSRPPPSSRFVLHGAVRRDVLLDRDELLIPEADPRFALARALAGLVDPALPRVLGAEAGHLRVERLVGAPVRSLSTAERAAVAAALTQLHRAGVAHGAVERALVRTPRVVVLAFPEPPPEQASATADLEALRRVP